MDRAVKSQHRLELLQALFHAPEPDCKVASDRREWRAFAKPFPAQRPVEPYAILRVLFAVPGIFLFRPKRIFQDEHRSQKKAGEARRTGQRTDDRREDKQYPAKDDHRPLEGTQVTQFFWILTEFAVHGCPCGQSLWRNKEYVH